MSTKKRVYALTKSDFVENFLWLQGKPFSLDEYPHMRRIYNTAAQESVMKFSRQCVHDDQIIHLASGKPVKAKDLQPGDTVIGFDEKTYKNKAVKVKKVWDNGVQKCVKIKSEIDHEIVVTYNHPIWTYNGWVHANKLEPGNFIGISRNNGFDFPEEETILDWKLNIWEQQYTTSYKKHAFKHPDFIWQLTKEQLYRYLCIILNGTNSKEDYTRSNFNTLIVSSKTLEFLKTLQFLLLKFKLRSFITPSIHYSFSYELHLTTQETKKEYLQRMKNEPLTKEHVLSILGAPRKRENLYPRPEILKFYRDTFEVVLPHYATAKGSWVPYSEHTLLRLHKDFPTDFMQKILEADHYYSRVEEKTPAGSLSTTAIEIEELNTFLIDNIITHNTAKSTTLANILLANTSMTPYLKQLYVSPAVSQTQEFSRDKLEPVIKQSPFIQKYMVNSKLIQNVYKKEFANGSLINLRYALLTADRVRGISSDVNLFDECYLPNMEVLTKEGWKDFKDLTLSDYLATSTKNEVLEYQKPSRIIQKDYSGRVFNIRGLAVTENHNLYLDGWGLVSATVAKHLPSLKMFYGLDIDSIQVTNFPSSTIIEEKYTGPVYCATVPNGTLVVRDKQEKGIFISGNCQDLRKDVISVIKETMTHSKVKKVIYAGTPKRTKGTLADLWFGSTQNEYMLKCDACNHWNVLGEDNIGPSGVICSKCSSSINAKNTKGQWVSTYTTNNKSPLEGYRVCLLHFSESPWVNWQNDIIYKRENTSKALFYNETLALEYDAGSIPITREEIIRACSPELKMDPEPDKSSKGYPSILGIDYGPVNSEDSHTVISISQVRNGILQIVYAKKFLGKEASYAYIHKEIPKLMQKWNCVHLAADYGMGEAPNSEFRDKLGIEKVITYQHLFSQKEMIRWNPKMPAYTLNKNTVLTQFFKWIKQGKIKFPRWEDFSTFEPDLRNVILEFDEEKNTTRYTNVGPDDFVHATVFAMMSAMMLFNLKD